jgi:sugar lactone lactonase YvrE
MVVGCGQQLPNEVPGRISQAPAFRADRKPASYVYLAQCCRQLFSNHGEITLYDLKLAGVARTITKGVSDPSFITVDRAGRIYLISYDYLHGVTEYDAGSEHPSRNIKLANAWAAATDSSNNLYAAVCPSCRPYGSGKGSIDVYEAGTTKMLRSIKKGIDAPAAVAVDTLGKLYVLNYNGSKTAVVVYAPGARRPLRTLQQGFTDPFAIAVDASDNLFVMRNGDTSGSPSIVEYAASSKRIVRAITQGLSSPQAMAIDNSGTLYVSNTPYPSQGWVSVYPPAASSPSYEISSGMHDPQLLTVDREGNLYVGNDYYAVALDRPDTSSGDSGSMCVYAPEATIPLSCVPNPQYSYPYSLAVRPR